MGKKNVLVRAEIDSETNKKAIEALKTMGLSVSDAIRLLMLRIAEDKCMPFKVTTRDLSTIEVIDELDSGKGFIDDLNVND